MALRTLPPIRIIPTIFATTLLEFRRRFNHLAPHFTELQIDIMDGRFVPAKSIDISKIPNLARYHARFEAHLMVQEPTPLVPLLAKKGFVRIIAHIESLQTSARAEAFLHAVEKEEGIEAGLAINPKTPIQKITPYLRKSDQIRLILFLGVQPGKEGQLFIPAVAKKINRFTTLTPKRVKERVLVQIDGGINPGTAKLAATSGVFRFNTGSYLSQAKDPIRAARNLRKMILKELRKENLE